MLILIFIIINKFDTERFALYMLDPENFYETIIFNSFIPRCSWVGCVNKSAWGKIGGTKVTLNSACTNGLTTICLRSNDFILVS